MQRQEIPNNTAEQVEAYIVESLDLIDRLDVPDDLREVAFQAAYAGFSSKQIVFQQPQPVDLGQLGRSLGRIN